jgi:hypothetical protein
MAQWSGLASRTFEGAQAMNVSDNTKTEAWQRQNLVELVSLAALQLHAQSGTFTLKDLVKMARKFHRNGTLSESHVAGVLTEACVELDLASGALRLAD